MKISWESGLLAALCTLDMLSTVWLVQNGKAIEANPIMRFYLDAGLFWFILTKVLLFVAPLFVLELIRNQRPQFVRGLLRFAIVLYLIGYGVGVWHVNSKHGVAQASEGVSPTVDSR